MRDEPSLRRQWLLLKALSTRRLGLTVREMAEGHGVTEKTVRRDLALFRDLGFPLEERVEEFGRKTWRIATAGGQPPLSFSFDEAVALHLGRRLLDPLAGTAFGDAARRAAQKVSAVLGREARAYLDRFAGLFHPTAFGAHDYEPRAELIDALQLAAEDHRVAIIRYQSERAAGPTDREVHPLGKVFHRGALYLVALDPKESRIKHYKVDRIEAAEVLSRTFLRPEDFDLEAHLADSFGVYHREGGPVRVVVRFAPSAARYVREASWHAGQRLEPEPDGGVRAEFRLCGTEELKRWVLSFGARAVVLEPEALRREITEELCALAAAYGETDRAAEAVAAQPQAPPPRRSTRDAARRQRVP